MSHCIHLHANISLLVIHLPVSVTCSSPSHRHALGSLLGSSVPSAASASQLRSRSRILLRRRGVGRSLVARWPLVPASEVPDDLVDQVRVCAAMPHLLVLKTGPTTSLGHGSAAGQVTGGCDKGAAENGKRKITQCHTRVM